MRRASLPILRNQIKPLEGVTVLLAEDCADTRLLISRVLSLAGASLEVVKNGLAAVEMVQQKNYDVILMDIQMPVMDGETATLHLRQSGCQIPIIGITAQGAITKPDGFRAQGFNDYLIKPFSRMELIDAIEHVAYQFPSQPEPLRPNLSKNF